MTKTENILKFAITLVIVLSGLIAYKTWPLRNDLALAQKDISSLQNKQKEVKEELDSRPREKELRPVLDNIQQQLNDHKQICRDLQASIIDLQKILIKLEAKVK